MSASSLGTCKGLVLRRQTAWTTVGTQFLEDYVADSRVALVDKGVEEEELKDQQ